MKTESLAEAIEYLEKAEEILRMRKSEQSHADDVYHGAVMSIAHQIKMLRNELHYAEKESLANWRRLSNTACTGLAPTAAQDEQGSTGASQ